MKRRNIISITVLNLLQIPNLDFSENFLVSCPNLQRFWLFVLQYTKEKAIKMNFLVILFHWIETERIAKNLIEISKFELSIEKTKKNQTTNLVYFTVVSSLYFCFVRKTQKKPFNGKFHEHSFVLI